MNNDSIDLSKEVLEQKVADFSNELATLQTKHGLVLLPRLRFTPDGVFPYLDIVSAEQLRQMTEAAQQAVQN